MAVNRNPNLIPRKSYFTVSPGMIRQLLVQGGLDTSFVEPVAHTLHKLFDKFGADERLNYDVIEKFMGQPAGTGAYPILVAANDTSDIGKAAAHYTCDGTDDDVEIQAAVDYLQSTTLHQGKIVLLEGTFNLSDTITILSEIEIEGLGKQITHLDGAGSRNTFEFVNVPYGRVAHLWFDTAKVAVELNTVDSAFTIEDCFFEACEESAIRSVFSVGDNFVDYFLTIAHNDFVASGSFGNNVVDIQQRTEQLIFTHNRFRNTLSSAMAFYMFANFTDTEQHGSFPRFVDNVFDRDVYMQGHNTMIMSANIFNQDLTLETISDAVITGNLCYGTYTETTCSGITKSGNDGIV